MLLRAYAIVASTEATNIIRDYEISIGKRERETELDWRSRAREQKKVTTMQNELITANKFHGGKWAVRQDNAAKRIEFRDSNLSMHNYLDAM